MEQPKVQRTLQVSDQRRKNPVLLVHFTRRGARAAAAAWLEGGEKTAPNEV